MPAKSKFQIKVEGTLLKYINGFLRYARFSHLGTDRRELIAGTFVYLLDEDDLVPDNVPNIGYLDDLMVFLAAAKHLSPDGKSISGVVKPEELERDLAFVEKNKGVLFTNISLSIEAIRKKGRESLPMFSELCKQIIGKYSHLGRVEE